MDIIANWNQIKIHFDKSFKSNFHVAVASVNKDSLPDVTPIGSLFLNRDQTGFYFEKYPSTIPENAEFNRHVSILGVNSNSWFWIKSLFKAKFNSYPGIKLYGILGEKRKATEKEISRLDKRMKSTRIFKGNNYLWGEMLYVRDLNFTGAKITTLGKMTAAL